MTDFTQEILDMYRSGRTPETIQQQINARLPEPQRLALDVVTAAIASDRKGSAVSAMTDLKLWHGDSIYATKLRIIEDYIAELEGATPAADAPVVATDATETPAEPTSEPAAETGTDTSAATDDSADAPKKARK